MHCVLNNPRNKRQTRMVAWSEEEPASAGAAQEEEEEEEEMLWRLRTITAAIEWRLIIHLRSSRSLSPYQAAQSALLSTALSILRGRLGLKMGG